MSVENKISTPQPPTPTPNYTTTQWTGTHVIDPALQQPQHTTTSPYQHYQFAYPYATHYQQYGHAQIASQLGQQQQPTVASVVRQTPAPQSSSSGMDTTDIATLNDALGSAGVDLRAEEESLQRSQDQHQGYRSYEDRSRKQPASPAFDSRVLGTTMRAVGIQHKVTRIPEDSVNYLALALRARLQDLVTEMINAAHHRTDTQFDRPASLYDDGTAMWNIIVRSDVAKQLAALEKAEREEEAKVRRERKERMELAAVHAAALAAQANGLGGISTRDAMDDGDGGSKKKRKKEGPGVTARNMSEDVRKKMSNAVATQAAGLGGKYAWMTAANATAPRPNVVPAATATTTTTAAPVAPAMTSTSAAASSWARPYVPIKKSVTPSPTDNEDDTRIVVTMRDAIFVIGKERGHGGGRGAARGWS